MTPCTQCGRPVDPRTARLAGYDNEIVCSDACAVEVAESERYAEDCRAEQDRDYFNSRGV